MIKNAHQLEVTLVAIARFERDLEWVIKESGLDSLWRQVYTDAIDSMMDSLQAEVDEYVKSKLTQE